MFYEKQTFVNKQVLEASHLNHIEEGIEALDLMLDAQTKRITDVQADVISNKGNMEALIEHEAELRMEADSTFQVMGENLLSRVKRLEEAEPETTTRITLLEEVERGAFYFDEMYNGYVNAEPSPLFTLTVGETYIVVWDDVEYTVTAQDSNGFINGTVCVGNAAGFADGLVGNNEPFVIAVGEIFTYFYVHADAENAEAETHKVAVYQDVAVPVLPTVTASDNGKFLRVVDGAWTAAVMYNAEEATF